jgi:hypothetical protein
MSGFANLVLLAIACLFPVIGSCQECHSLNSASIQQAEDYINTAGDEAEFASCVQIAFHRIAGFPPQQAIPTLIKYLSYKRPLNEAERDGFGNHNQILGGLYPAAHELCQIAFAAEPKVAVEPELIAYIANDENANGLALENALRTLLTIRHGDIVSLIHKLHVASESSTSLAARERLQSAASTIAGWCRKYDERNRPKCEAALFQ